MKLFLSLVLLFVVGTSNCQQPKQAAYNLKVFTNIPKDLPTLSDCGAASYYLSKQDFDNGKIICSTDYDVVLIYINKKQLRLKLTNHNRYISGKYTLTIKDGKPKPVGDETWTMKSIITVRYDGKLIWTKKLIGFGGC